jgi:PAS domain-containing protein
MTVQILAGYWSLDLKSRELLLCSRSRQMFGIDRDSPKKLGKQDWLPRIHPDDIPAIEGELETAGRLDEIYTARFRAVRPDGSLCQILGVGRAAVRDRTQFVGLNFDLAATAEIADLESEGPGGVPARFANPLTIRPRPANENETRRGLPRSSLRAKPSALGGRAKEETTRKILLERALATMQLRHAARIGTIHEEVGQRLTAISLAVGAIEAGAEIADSLILIRVALEEARHELKLHRNEAQQEV